MTMPDPNAQKFARQKRLVQILAVAMIVAGAGCLFLLRKPPLGLRLSAGLGDIFMGCVLLVMVRQQR